MDVRRLLGAFLVSMAALAQTTAPANFNKAKIEAFVRYAEGYTAQVKIAVDDPKPSEFAGFQRVVVHLTMGPQTLDKIYYLSADGRNMVNGTLWNSASSPFADNLLHLPRTGPSFGPANAPVSIVVFSDFQCPYCRSFAKVLREKVPAKYRDEVRVEFADFPIAAIHSWAVPAAALARCFSKADNNQFWSFHDWIFEHQGEISNDNLKAKVTEFAKTLGDSKVRDACLGAGGEPAAVTESIATGSNLGVQQTPTFFINGRQVSGALPWEQLDAVIQLELHRPAEVPGPMVEHP